MNALKDPQFVIGNQTFKIIRLENELKEKDKRIFSLLEEKEEMTRKINSLQKEVILLKEPPKKEKRVEKRNYLKLPKKTRRFVITPIDEDVIMKVLSEYFKTSVKKLSTKGRTDQEAIKRQWFMYFLYSHTLLTYKEIGQRFNRHHTSAIHSVYTAQRAIDVNPTAEEMYNKIKYKCLLEAQKHA